MNPISFERLVAELRDSVRLSGFDRMPPEAETTATEVRKCGFREAAGRAGFATNDGFDRPAWSKRET